VTRWIELGALPIAAVGVLMLAWAAVMLARPREGRCPGPREPWYEWLLPWRWAVYGCGYDLSGLALPVRCPECGTEHTGRIASRPVGRRVVMGMALLVLAAACWNVRWIRRCEWLRYLPTDVVITLERYTPLPNLGREVLSQRLQSMSARERARTARLAVHSLGTDDRKWNAWWAMDVLERLEAEADALLIRALDDEDYQRRQLAAALLRLRVKAQVNPATPTDRLFAVSVEGLKDDWIDGTSAWSSNASEAFLFLLRYPEQTAPHLKSAINSDDRQQAFLSAAVAGLTRRMELADIAVPLLAEHLASDEKWGNAVVALPAILGFGERARQILATIQPRDEQQQSLLEIELKLLDGIPLSPQDQRALQEVTRAYRDPREVFHRPEMLRGQL
jgi:hypothetical protein